MHRSIVRVYRPVGKVTRLASLSRGFASEPRIVSSAKRFFRLATGVGVAVSAGTIIEHGDPRYSRPSSITKHIDEVKTTIGLRNAVQGQHFSDLRPKVTWIPSTEPVGKRARPIRIEWQVGESEEFWKWRAEESKFWENMMDCELSNQAEYSISATGQLECRVPGVVVMSMHPNADSRPSVEALVHVTQEKNDFLTTTKTTCPATSDSHMLATS